MLCAGKLQVDMAGLLAKDGCAGVALLGSRAVPRTVPAWETNKCLHLLYGLVLHFGFLKAHHISVLCLDQLLHCCWVL
jgi:hypothetical protein